MSHPLLAEFGCALDDAILQGGTVLPQRVCIGLRGLRGDFQQTQSGKKRIQCALRITEKLAAPNVPEAPPQMLKDRLTGHILSQILFRTPAITIARNCQALACAFHYQVNVTCANRPMRLHLISGLQQYLPHLLFQLTFVGLL